MQLLRKLGSYAKHPWPSETLGEKTLYLFFSQEKALFQMLGELDGKTLSSALPLTPLHEPPTVDAMNGSREQVLTEEQQAQSRPKPTNQNPTKLQAVSIIEFRNM